MKVENKALDNITNALNGKEVLLMKKKIIAAGKNYAVMDENQNHLCYVYLSAGQNLAGKLLSSVAGSWAGREMSYTYLIQDSANQNALILKKGAGAWSTTFIMHDAVTEEQVAMISLKRGLIGGMQAQWTEQSNNQVTMTTKGNVMRRQYAIVDQNQNEIGSVRHKIAAVRDTWSLNLSPHANILNAAIFAAVLDFEKEM